jgi:hypothetical protein
MGKGVKGLMGSNGSIGSMGSKSFVYKLTGLQVSRFTN